MANNSRMMESTSGWIAAAAGLAAVAAGSYLTSQASKRRGASSVAHGATSTGPKNTSQGHKDDERGHQEDTSQDHKDDDEGGSGRSGRPGWLRRSFGRLLLSLVFLVAAGFLAWISFPHPVFAAVCDATGAVLVGLGGVLGVINRHRPVEKRRWEWSLVAVGGVGIAASAMVSTGHHLPQQMQQDLQNHALQVQVDIPQTNQIQKTKEAQRKIQERIQQMEEQIQELERQTQETRSH